MSFADDLNAATNPNRNGEIIDELPSDYDYSGSYTYLSNNKDKIVNEIVTNIRNLALERAKNVQKRSMFDNKRYITVGTDWIKLPCLSTPSFHAIFGRVYKVEIEWKDLYLYIVNAARNELSKDGFYEFVDRYACGWGNYMPLGNPAHYYADRKGYDKNRYRSLVEFRFECTICVKIK